jgi:hypothetical protein
MNIEILQSVIALGGVPIIVGLVEVIKPFCVDARFYPIFALLLGLLLNIGVAWVLTTMAKPDIVVAVLNGVLAGLAASGLYSGYKATKG